mgnify:CR=1 FL=1
MKVGAWKFVCEGKSWETGSSEVKRVRMREFFFADDTTLLGEYG